MTMRAILVDDEKEFVSTLVERLALRGIEADWTLTGEEAIRLAEQKPYDLAILDVKMPGMSGFSLKKALQDKYPSMKFIFLTGHGSEKDYTTGSSETGAEYYLVKPIDINMLIEKMTEIVGEE